MSNTKPRLKVAMIGYAFMGKAHSNAWRQAPHYFDLPFDIEMDTICGRNKENTDAARDKLGWKNSCYNWQEVINNPEIDVVDINTPNDTHAEIAIAAAKAGKSILCEKPLAKDLEQAREMVKAVEAAGVIHMLCHNYRRVPAIALAKKIIESGNLGSRIYHFHARYSQDWLVNPNFPMNWRMEKSTAGSGANGDIHAHIIDLAHFLVGDFKQITANFTTFIKERPIEGNPGQKGTVSVDDSTQMIGNFKCGALANLEASRFATGRKNHIVFEINAEKGSLRFNFEDMNRLELYETSEDKQSRGFKSIIVTESDHPYVGHYWPPGHIIGYEHTFINTIADFVAAVKTGEPPNPNFNDGLKVQTVLEAAQKSASDQQWKELKY